MPVVIDRHVLQQLIQQGAQLVDVLPMKEYGAEHILGAVNIPLRTLSRETVKRLDRTDRSSRTATTTSET